MKTFLCTNTQFGDIDDFETHQGSCLKDAAIKALQETKGFLSWCTGDFDTKDYEVMADDILGNFEDYNWQIFDISNPENVEKIFQTKPLENE
jgi:hypothetical protein